MTALRDATIYHFSEFLCRFEAGRGGAGARVAASAGNGSRLTRFRVTEYNLGP
jgi:hypothetical protein